MNNQAPTVTAVVLSFNSCDALRRTIAAVRAQSVSIRKIIVVDNGSTDGTPELLLACRNKVEVLMLHDNKGVGAGHNAGWRMALGDEAMPDFVWELEHDSLPERDCLQRLLETFGHLTARGHRVGAVVPRQVLPSDSDARVQTGAGRLPFVAPRLTFNATLFPVDAIERAGWLREDFFIGHEDREYASRLTEAGYAVVHDPDAIVVHRNKGRRPYPARSVLRDYYSFRNELYLRRNIRREPWALPKLLLRSAGHVGRLLAQGDQRRRRIHARGRAFVDGARGSLGEKRYPFLSGEARG